MFAPIYGAINSVADKNKKEESASLVKSDNTADSSRSDSSSSPPPPSSSSHLLPNKESISKQEAGTINICRRITSLFPSSCNNNNNHKTNRNCSAVAILSYMLAYILLFPPLFFLICRIPATPLFVKTDYPSPDQLQTSYNGNNDDALSVLSSSSSRSLPSHELDLISNGGPLNHFTYVGTHNSYHMANIIGSLFIPEWRYSHESLQNQLNLGIRHLELDIWYNADTEYWEVWHQTVDAISNSPTLLVDCLHIIHNWSLHHKKKENEKHFPLWINLDLKGSYYAEKWFILPCRWGEASHGVVIEALHGLEDLIMSVWGKDEVLTPTQLVDMATERSNSTEIKDAFNPLRKAVETYGWPDVKTLAGKSLFQLNLYSENAEYRMDAPNNVLFVRGDANYKTSQHAFFNDAALNHTADQEAIIQKNELGGKTAENFVYFEADRHRNQSLNYQHHFPNAIFRAAILRQDLYYHYQKEGNFNKKETYDDADPNNDGEGPKDGVVPKEVAAEMYGGYTKRRLRGGEEGEQRRRALRHKYSASEIDEAARKETQRLVKHGVHLIATDHPRFAAGSPFIFRNGLWKGDSDDEEVLE